MQEPTEFERLVAELFRKAGAQKVEHNVLVGGFQIDVLVQTSWQGIYSKLAVECKLHARPVGPGIVNDFGKILDGLRARRQVDLGVIVSKSGFTMHAREAASEHGVTLLEPADIGPSLSSIDIESTFASMGSEIYAAIDALNGASLDEPRERFLSTAAAIARARKRDLVVESQFVQKQCHRCIEIAANLGPAYQAMADILIGMLSYDAGNPAEAKRQFQAAYETAHRHHMKPLILEAQFWLARCASQIGDTKIALQLLEEVVKGTNREPALANLKVKAEYWKAKVDWIAFQQGLPLIKFEEIQRRVRFSMAVAGDLGLINYAEGCRGLLGEMELSQGNNDTALRLLLLSQRRTPHRQDKAKLQPLIDSAKHKLPPEIVSSICTAIADEPLLRIDFRAGERFARSIEMCEHAIWRFSYFQRDRIFPVIFPSTGSWVDGIRELLSDDEFLEYCIARDTCQLSSRGRVLYTGERKYRSLREKVSSRTRSVNSSNLIHRLEMCRRMLATGVLVADTGKNGGVCLVPLSDKAALEVAEWREGTYKMQPTTEFSFRYTSRPLKTLHTDVIKTIRSQVEMLCTGFIEHCSARGAFPLSIDFLISEKSSQIIEAHYPSRGFEILYSPFRDFTTGARFPLDIYADHLGQYAKRMGIGSILLTHLDELRTTPDRPRTEFYDYEFGKLAGVLAKHLRGIDMRTTRTWSDTGRKDGKVTLGTFRPELVIFDDVDPRMPMSTAEPQTLLPDHRLIRFISDRNLVKQLCVHLGISTPKWVTVRRGSAISMHRLRDMLGRYIVAKDQHHLPSWHIEKRRCEFLDLEDSRHCSRLKSRTQLADTIMEELVSDSIDSVGHLGELRVHVCVSD